MFEDWEVLEDIESLLETLILMLVKDPYLEWQSIIETCGQVNILSRLKTGKHLNIQRAFQCGLHMLQMVNHGSVKSSGNQLAALRISPCGSVKWQSDSFENFKYIPALFMCSQPYSNTSFSPGSPV